MGITSLLPFLERTTQTTNIRDHKGCRVAVDAYCLLHKAAPVCAKDIVMGKLNLRYVEYVMKYVKMLLDNRITPIMVFDGMHLPAKSSTESKRRKNREQAKKQAIEFMRLGQTNEAHSYFMRCINITHEMASNVIKACRDMGVDCIVAPYEADSQLAYLNLNGFVDFVISEDSDLLLFGCTKVLYKLDRYGNGQMVIAKGIANSMGLSGEKYTFDKFLHMCVLSGCDYLDSLPGIGLKKALKFLKITAEEDPVKFLGKIPQYLNMRNLTITDEYKEGFLKAVATFRHQVIYNIETESLERLNPLEDEDYERFCCNAGDLNLKIDPQQLALGNYDPFTLKKVNDFTVDPYKDKASIWNRNYVWKVFNKCNVDELADWPKPKPHIVSLPEVSQEVQMRMAIKYDEQINEELKMYMTSNDHHANDDDVDNDEDMETDGRISPIITSNPFKRFKSSLSSGNRMVMSRHWSSNVLKAIPNCDERNDENAEPGDTKSQTITVQRLELVKEDICPIPLDAIPLPINVAQKACRPPARTKQKTMRQTRLMDFFANKS